MPIPNLIVSHTIEEISETLFRVDFNVEIPPDSGYELVSSELTLDAASDTDDPPA
jgi:hypothetical protein